MSDANGGEAAERRDYRYEAEGFGGVGVRAAKPAERGAKRWEEKAGPPMESPSPYRA